MDKLGHHFYVYNSERCEQVLSIPFRAPGARRLARSGTVTGNLIHNP